MKEIDCQRLDQPPGKDGLMSNEYYLVMIMGKFMTETNLDSKDYDLTFS